MKRPRSFARAALLPLAIPCVTSMTGACASIGGRAGTGDARAAGSLAFGTAGVPAAPSSALLAAPDRRAVGDLSARDSAAHAPATLAPVAVAGPDRPGYSFTPVTVPFGGMQLETGYTNTRTGSVHYQALGEQLLRLGVGGATELRFAANSFALRAVAVPGAPVQHTRGLEDAKIGIKHQLLAGSGSVGVRATSVAVMAGTSVPSGARTFGAGAWQPEATVIVNTPLTARVALLTNLSDSYAARSATPDGRRDHHLGVTGASWFTLTPRLSAFGEYAGSRFAGAGAAAVHYTDAGVALTPVPSLQLDVRAGRGLNGVSGDYFVGAGLTRRW